jgi:tRNA(Ile)-lysidine synthase
MLEQRVLHYLHRYEIGRGSKVLVAFSGGPDSLCLLRVLQRIGNRHPLALRAAYLDHWIRPEAERKTERRFVRATCSRLGVELSWHGFSEGVLEQRAESTGRSLEEIARRARYEFLGSAASQTGCEYIALGHTADDQVETVVMRFFQGVDLSGLPGIPPRREELIRPLIDCTRSEILGYLQEQGLHHVADSTNLDRRYLRNAVRWELLPAAERVFPGFRGSVLSLSKKLARVRAYVEEESRRRLVWKPVRGGYCISGKEFLEAPGLLRLYSITNLLKGLTAALRVPYRFLSAVEQDEVLIKRRVVLSGYGLRLYWKGEKLFLTAHVVGHKEKGYFIGVNEGGPVLVPEAGLLFEFGSPVRDADLWLFRSCRAGDRIAMQSGTKTVRSLFSQWGVMRQEAWKIPILEARAGVAAVFGSLFGYEDAFRSDVSRERGKELKSMVHRYDVEVE